MKWIYSFLLFGLITLIVAITIVKVGNFSGRNKFYHFVTVHSGKWQLPAISEAVYNPERHLPL